MYFSRAIFLIFGLVTLVSCSSNKIVNSKQPPNFILILSDDQGWNGTSVQMMDNLPSSKSDYHETPNLERLSNSGMRFSSAYASAPVCSPSRYSIQFGQTPARLRMIRVGMNTSHINHQSSYTIPKLLKKINPNYKTAHFGKWGIDAHPSILGYDESDGITKNKDGGFNPKSGRKQWQNNIDVDPKKIFSTTQKAIDFINSQANSKTPFFLQISHYAVHSDIISKEKTLEKYKNKAKGKYQNHAGFAAMTEDLDSGVGILLDRLKALGLEKNTYVIYTSDNGAVPIMPPKPKYYRGSNFPLSRGKWDAMEGGVRVPFIISGPKVKAGEESKIPITHSDILPTIIDLAGKKLDQTNDNLDGGSFKHLLDGLNNKKIIRNYKGLVFHVPYENGIALKRAHSAMIIDNYKLIKFYDNNEFKLFDLVNDIEEKNNLVNTEPLVFERMKISLEDYLHDVKAPRWKSGITWKKTPIDIINSFH